MYSRDMVRVLIREKSEEGIITDALLVLGRGGIIAYPTESYYALGVMADNEDALTKLFSLKKRPPGKAMPVIVGSKELVGSLVKSVPNPAFRCMEQYWPGALTLVFDAKDTLPTLLLGRTGKIAVRVPGESFALRLAKAANSAVTATSANISGSSPSRTADQVIHYFHDELDMVIDGGTTPGGMPSTIVDVTVVPPKVLREGRIMVKFT